MSRRDLGPWAIFGAPLVIAILALTGLVGALLADGAWDWIGAVLLAGAIAGAVAGRMFCRIRNRAERG
ncbi:hypothetical protein N0B44_07075 [Roseibacterium beibuensis]|uniref:hypothetical protein n=1 Tax=[Roseibacterium] beibuensis TaxID=1193142 RepID=UPI00217E68F4|nr:hypothetical protein [Roseibacterium beibuensis]MCS6622666.1 hypothetical protein [Roseibacterium beibuensis]